MNSNRVVVALFALLASPSYGGSTVDAEAGNCELIRSGHWVLHSSGTLEGCLKAIRQQTQVGRARFGRWNQGLIAYDGVGFLSSDDGGRRWKVLKIWETRESSTETAELPPIDGKASTIDGLAVGEPPKPAVDFRTTDEPAPPSSETDLAAADAAAEAHLQPTDAPPRGANQSDGRANPRSSPVEPSPSAEPINLALSLDTDLGSEERQDARATETLKPMTRSPAPDAVTPPPVTARAPDSARAECRIRSRDRWIESKAPSILVCAKLLDQAPENYDQQGLKYAYYRNQLLVANKHMVYAIMDDAERRVLIKRHRY